MDAREERGLLIAKTAQLKKKTSNEWIVPSQTEKKQYHVNPETHTCTCPDCMMRKVKCKHIWAVEYTIKMMVDEHGNKSIEKKIKVTYTQDWTAYNQAQCNEKQLFMSLLSDLCATVQNPEYNFGRPTLSFGDMIFCTSFKVYSQFSGRRFTTDMNYAKENGLIDKAPHFNSVFNYLKKKELTPILSRLIQITSLPLREVEHDFAIDSSGFSTSEFKRWYDFKYGKETEYRIWLKAHINTGIKTNIITAVKITGSTANDSPQFEKLFLDTTQNFDVWEQSADKAYSSKKNLEVVTEKNATPYIPFKSNVTGKQRGSAIWKKMYHLFNYKQDEFYQHYHKRSNVETTFHMIKSKFGKELKSKTKTAQINELLCKIICHNIVVLIHEMFELGIEADFSAQKVGILHNKSD